MNLARREGGVAPGAEPPHRPPERLLGQAREPRRIRRANPGRIRRSDDLPTPERSKRAISCLLVQTTHIHSQAVRYHAVRQVQMQSPSAKCRCYVQALGVIRSTTERGSVSHGG
jgi:hypothetical protein